MVVPSCQQSGPSTPQEIDFRRILRDWFQTSAFRSAQSGSLPLNCMHQADILDIESFHSSPWLSLAGSPSPSSAPTRCSRASPVAWPFSVLATAVWAHLFSGRATGAGLSSGYGAYSPFASSKISTLFRASASGQSQTLSVGSARDGDAVSAISSLGRTVHFNGIYYYLVNGDDLRSLRYRDPMLTPISHCSPESRRWARLQRRTTSPKLMGSAISIVHLLSEARTESMDRVLLLPAHGRAIGRANFRRGSVSVELCQARVTEVRKR